MKMICIRTSWNTMTVIETTVGQQVSITEFMWMLINRGPQWALWTNPLPLVKKNLELTTSIRKFAGIRELEIHLTSIFGIETPVVGSARAWK